MMRFGCSRSRCGHNRIAAIIGVALYALFLSEIHCARGFDATFERSRVLPSLYASSRRAAIFFPEVFSFCVRLFVIASESFLCRPFSVPWSSQKRRNRRLGSHM